VHDVVTDVAEWHLRQILAAIEYLLLSRSWRLSCTVLRATGRSKNTLNPERHWKVIEVCRKSEGRKGGWTPSKPISGICFQDISNVGLGTLRRPRVPVWRLEPRLNNVEKWISDIFVQFCQWVSRPVLHTECERWNPGLICRIYFDYKIFL